MRPNAYNNSKIYDYFVFIKLIFNILPKNVNNNYFFLMSIVEINTLYEFYVNDFLNEIRVYRIFSYIRNFDICFEESFLYNNTSYYLWYREGFSIEE